MPRAIVLALDQLSRRCLGCYGHEWIETPNLDRLALRGVVFDQCIASPAPESALHDAALSLCTRLRDASVGVSWLQESEESAASDDDDLNENPLSRLVTDAESALSELSRDHSASWLLWIESHGIGWPGVATSQFLELYVDELDDEVPADLVAIREIEVAYAALLTQFDHLLGRLLTTIERLFGDAPPLLVFVAAHGQAVGELELLSPFADRPGESPINASSFRDELVHSPLLIAGATREPLGGRRQELVTPADVLPTLSDWFGSSFRSDAPSDATSLLPVLRNEECSSRAEVFLRDTEDHFALRSEQVLFVQAEAIMPLAQMPADNEIDGDDSAGSLFLKPEDVWEVNDVAAQHPERVAALSTALNAWVRSHQLGRHDSKAAEVSEDAAALFDRHRNDTRPSGDNLAGEKSDAV